MYFSIVHELRSKRNNLLEKADRSILEGSKKAGWLIEQM